MPDTSSQDDSDATLYVNITNPKPAVADDSSNDSDDDGSE
jgi:hypothetical protein